MTKNSPASIIKNKFISPLSKAFSTEDSRFKISVALKVMMVPIIASIFLGYMLWVLVRMNNIFFEANGFMGLSELRDAYFDFILMELSTLFPYIGGVLILLFFTGMYIGSLLLRPFAIIGAYCEKAIHDENVVYEPDMFSDYKLLTRFSEHFFSYIRNARKEGKLLTDVIPLNYTRIHKPVFDKIFFFHFSLFLSIISIISSVLLVIIAVDIHESIIQLAIKALKLKGQSSTYFLLEQSFIMQSVTWVTVAIIVLGYLLLALHLYGRVAGPAFGFFATMRSFMKGNFHTRVHLLDFNHIRPYSRVFNKYLDYIQKNVVPPKN